MLTQLCGNHFCEWTLVFWEENVMGMMVWVGVSENLEEEAGVASSQKEARVSGGKVR